MYLVVVITGARQVGKSTITTSLVKDFNFNYVSFDDIDNRRIVLEDSKMFI